MSVVLLIVNCQTS